MPNNGAVAITPSASSQAIAVGYHNGSGTVAGVTVPAANVLTGTTIAGTAGTMPNRGTVNYTPSTVNQTVLGGNHSGSGVVFGDANLTAPNILIGSVIYGITGTGGVRYASGTVTSSAGNLSFTMDNGSSASNPHVTVSGLSFTPSVIQLFQSFGPTGTVYSNTLIASSSKIACHNTLFRLDGANAYVNGTGFRLPIIYASQSVTWRAFE